MKRTGKRGISHVEVIMSYSLFILAVMLAFTFFNPTRTLHSLSSSLAPTVVVITDQTNVEVETYGVLIDVTAKQTDKNKKNDDYIAVRLEENNRHFTNPTGVVTRVETLSGEVLPSALVRDKKMVYFDWDETKGNFVSVKLSADFAPSVQPPKTKNPNGNQNLATLVSYLNRNLTSEKKIRDLISALVSNYQSTKRNLGLEAFDVGVRLALQDAVLESAAQPPEQTQVFSQTRRVEMLRSGGSDDGKEQFGDLGVKIW